MLILINHAFAIIIAQMALSYQTGTIMELFRRKHAGKLGSKFIRGLRKEERYQKVATHYFLVTGLITTGAFVIIQFISENTTEGILSEIISTGIHVPFVLMICGLALKPFNISTEDKKKLLFLITLTTSVSFMFWNWKLGLLAFSIVLGKYIWIDFTFDYKPGTIIKYFSNLKNGSSTESIIVLYCVFYLCLFFGLQIGTMVLIRFRGWETNQLWKIYASIFVIMFSILYMTRIKVLRAIEEQKKVQNK